MQHETNRRPNTKGCCGGLSRCRRDSRVTPPCTRNFVDLCLNQHQQHQRHVRGKPVSLLGSRSLEEKRTYQLSMMWWASFGVSLECHCHARTTQQFDVLVSNQARLSKTILVLASGGSFRSGSFAHTARCRLTDSAVCLRWVSARSVWGHLAVIGACQPHTSPPSGCVSVAGVRVHLALLGQMSSVALSTQLRAWWVSKMPTTRSVTLRRMPTGIKRWMIPCGVGHRHAALGELLFGVYRQQSAFLGQCQCGRIVVQQPRRFVCTWCGHTVTWMSRISSANVSGDCALAEPSPSFTRCQTTAIRCPLTSMVLVVPVDFVFTVRSPVACSTNSRAPVVMLME